ncbi:MAG: hypothetical protein AMXMBFR34_42620 [Myxococcaceae bacterium]
MPQGSRSDAFAWAGFLAMSDEQPQPRGGGGAGQRILMFIGIIVALNVLSQVFNWGFIFY